jgi:hypothetical protein
MEKRNEPGNAQRRAKSGVEFKRRPKPGNIKRDLDGAELVSDGEQVHRWAIVGADGLVVNVVDASEAWVKRYRGEYPGCSIVRGEECGGAGWRHEGGKFIEPVNPKLMKGAESA